VGTGPAVSEWFARALGGNGKVYTGVGGKYRTTGTFALNPFAHGGDVFMGSTFGPSTKKMSLEEPFMTIWVNQSLTQR
jgi:hypothetical protein